MFNIKKQRNRVMFFHVDAEMDLDIDPSFRYTETARRPI